jgi:hypothetical protein
LETYIYNDPCIRELINQILESIITACLLLEVDSDAKFQKGCQIIINLTTLLQEITTLQSEYLAERVQQILKQPLPDVHAVNSMAADKKSTQEVNLETPDSYPEKPKNDLDFIADSKQAHLLRRTLSKFFPESTIYWYKSLIDQTFLVQAKDILICIHDSKRPCDLQKYNRDGWKVLVCSTQDLNFPRRMEREIRQLLRTRLPIGLSVPVNYK